MTPRSTLSAGVDRVAERGTSRVRGRAARSSPALLLVFTTWSLVFYEPHWLVPALIGGGGPVLKRIPIFLLLPLFLIMLQRDPIRTTYRPLLLFLATHVLMVPFAHNRGFAQEGLEQMVYLFIVFSSTLAVVRTPESALTLFKLFLLSFPWYCVQGAATGRVWWHTELGNPDAFGPLGVMATGLGYYVGLGSRDKKWRYTGFAIAALGVVAMVSSFARGAFLAGAAVLVTIWMRSPRKLAALAGGVAGLLVLLATAEILFPDGAFWTEMGTISEGNTTGTGASRWALWRHVGLRLFADHPFFGVGAYNTGPVAVEVVPPGLLPGRYANPATLYHRPLHNVYLQLLAEQGLVGVGIWGFMLFDFFRRLARIRKRGPRAVWAQRTGGRIDLLHISLGLEAAMIGFLVGGVFYNQLYRHWFYTLLVLALILSDVTRAGRPRFKAAPGAGARGSVASRAAASSEAMTSERGA